MFHLDLHLMLISYALLTTILVKVLGSSSNLLPAPIFHRLLRNNYHGQMNLLETACDGDFCYEVFDMMVYVDYFPQMMRVFGMDLESGLAFSMMPLKMPKELTMEALDLKNWSVDRKYVNFGQYSLTIAEAFFSSGAIPTVSSSSFDVLMIGLGGANFNNYFDEQYPQLNVTVVELSPLVTSLSRRWFGIRESQRHRVRDADGVEYIKTAAREGVKYSGALLDATYSTVDRLFVAPIEEFLEEEMAETVAEVVEQDGVLLMNIVTGKQCENRVQCIDKLVRLYKPHFPFIRVDITSDFNAVLIARRVEIIEPVGYRKLVERPYQFY